MTRIVAVNDADLKSSIRNSLSADIVLDACRSVGHTWRETALNPANTIWMFVLQIIHCNTACAHAVRLVAGVDVTDSAFCQARTRIPLAAFHRLFNVVTQRLLDASDRATERWLGHRVFWIDGTSCSMPDTPSLQERFGQPTPQKEGCGFPTANIVALFHRTGMLAEFVVNKAYTHEARVAHTLFDRLVRGDIVVGDRGFASYTIIAALRLRGMHAVMREHQRRPVDFRCGTRISRHDQIVVREKPKCRPKWMTKEQFDELPESCKLRRIRYQIKTNGFRTTEVVIITTLLDDEKYPAADLQSLYGERWEAETCFRHLKHTLRMDVLKCKTPDGVQKELLIYGIAYNHVRAIMVQAGINQGVPPNRISLIDVVRRIMLGPLDYRNLPRFKVNPKRAGRVEPRVKKRRDKSYKLMTKPRYEYHKDMRLLAL